MPYEVRVGGKAIAVHETQRDAMAQVKDLLAGDADTQAEIIDTATGQPAAPASSTAEREDFARKVGF